MALKSIMLIVNPNSGKSKPKSMLFEIIGALSQKDCMVTTLITQKEGDAKDFALFACEDKKYDMINNKQNNDRYADTALHT